MNFHSLYLCYLLVTNTFPIYSVTFPIQFISSSLRMLLGQFWLHLKMHSNGLSLSSYRRLSSISIEWSILRTYILSLSLCSFLLRRNHSQSNTAVRWHKYITSQFLLYKQLHSNAEDHVHKLKFGQHNTNTVGSFLKISSRLAKKFRLPDLNPNSVRKSTCSSHSETQPSCSEGYAQCHLANDTTDVTPLKSFTVMSQEKWSPKSFIAMPINSILLKPA